MTHKPQEDGWKRTLSGAVVDTEEVTGGEFHVKLAATPAGEIRYSHLTRRPTRRLTVAGQLRIVDPGGGGSQTLFAFGAIETVVSFTRTPSLMRIYLGSEVVEHDWTATDIYRVTYRPDGPDDLRADLYIAEDDTPVLSTTLEDIPELTGIRVEALTSSFSVAPAAAEFYLASASLRGGAAVRPSLLPL